MWDFNSDHFWVLLIFLIIAAWAIHHEIEHRKEKAIVDAERDTFLRQPVPLHIQRAMADFTQGRFTGEDQSPLAYVGYKAGKTAGMSDGERRERLAFCFRAEIPPDLPAKYQNWGAPATLHRFQAIARHLSMLAGQRRSRAGYQVAVDHWDSDKVWFQAELSGIAQRFGCYGYRR